MNEADIEKAGGATKPQLDAVRGLAAGAVADLNSIKAGSFRSPPIAGTIGVLGDSRQSEIISAPGELGFQFLNHASYFLGGRLRPVFNGAVSGWRSDQYLGTHLNAALASTAQIISVHGVFNDINLGYTSDQIWGGYNGKVGMKAAFDSILAAGKVLLCYSEPGGVAATTGWSASKCADIAKHNQRIREYAEQHAGVLFFDLAGAIWDKTNASVAFKSNLSGDGIHLINNGSVVVGKYIADALGPYLTPRPKLPFGPGDANSSYGDVKGRNYLGNGMFLTTTGGTAGTGITGSAPNGFTVSRWGGATATLSTEANAAGNGNNLVLACTFTANTDYIEVAAYPPLTGWVAGNPFEAWAAFDVDSGYSGFGGVGIKTNVVSDGGSANVSANFAGGAISPLYIGAYGQTLRTGANIVASGTVTNVNYYVRIYGAGSGGSATVRLHELGLVRRLSAPELGIPLT